MMKDLFMQRSPQDQPYLDQKVSKLGGQGLRVVMDQTELSLGPSNSSIISEKTTTHSSNSSESDGNTRKKRKQLVWDELLYSRQSSIELQLNDPLPLDWEQCLDLQTGRMYYLNRKTMKKSWMRPAAKEEEEEEEEVNLDLNISTFSTSEEKALNSQSLTNPEEANKQYNSGGGGMVAVVCINCHLLVMLCKLSPLCPNCKYVHSQMPPSSSSSSLPQAPPPRKLEAGKPLETLSLLH